MKTTLLAVGVVFSMIVAPARAQLLISELLPNPGGTDSPFEYVELIAASDIDFSLTPYSVVFANNGSTSFGTNGWVTGGTITYGFSINSGTVSRGDVVYVGGSSMSPTGVKLRTIDTLATPGDGFGTPSPGVLGNGGAVADGIAVFNVGIGGLTASLSPIDAIFFGSAAGNVLGGYTVPNNDRYSGGNMSSTGFIGPDPGGDQTIVAAGVYNPQTGMWEAARNWTLGTLTDGASTLVLVPVPEPSAAALMLLAGVVGAVFYARKRK